MVDSSQSLHVAVIGAGLAGAACAAGLRKAGVEVTIFEKSTQVGGRMASRSSIAIDGTSAENSFADVDYGAQWFTPVRPRFRLVTARAIAAHSACEWRPRVHTWRSAQVSNCVVLTPNNVALCHHLLAGTCVHLGHPVLRLQRAANGTWFVAAEGAPLAGPFDNVVLAMPPTQAAVLVAGHHDAWADALMAKRTDPCWSLTAVTDDVDWPWDAAEPDTGPLAWVSRNDRVPGRAAVRGLAIWTARATAKWSAAHLEADPQAVRDKLQDALRSQLPCAAAGNDPVRWHHLEVHRWRHAGPAFDCDDSFDGDEAWWDASLGLGVCGDFLGGGGVEAAWHSGDELADAIAASFELRSDTSRVAWELI